MPHKKNVREPIIIFCSYFPYAKLLSNMELFQVLSTILISVFRIQLNWCGGTLSQK